MELPQGQQIHVRQPHIIFTISDPELFSPILFYAFSILIAHTLYSGILAYLSSAALVSQFAFPSGKWNGIQLSPGEVFVPTRAVDSMDPRLEETLTLSPFFDTQLIGIYDVHFDK